MLSYEETVKTCEAVATVVIAVMAIWGEKVRALFASPKLELEPHTFGGEATKLTADGLVIAGGGMPAFY